MSENGPVSCQRGFVSHEQHLPSEVPCSACVGLTRSQSDVSALGSCPPHGAKSICGKRSQMEDTFTVHPNLLDVPVPPGFACGAADKLPARIAPQLDSNSRCSTLQFPVTFTSGSVPFPASNSQVETLHFFGVYDGHGGIEAAQHCANRLHQNLCAVLATDGWGTGSDLNTKITQTPEQNSTEIKSQQVGDTGHDAVQEEPACAAEPNGSVQLPPWQRTLCEGFDDSETEASRSFDRCVSSSNSSSSSGSSTSSDSSTLDNILEAALKKAFVRTDDEFASAKSAALVGSTAIVALVSSRTLLIANCGDSRAVLRRGGKAVPLSDDHKPEREDEAERVEKLGGQVLFWNGHRVMGVLAMSRAIGDHCLRPYVIPEPEISVVARCESDEVLLLASDGLWDVMSNQEASDLAGRCLQRAGERGASRRAAARIAASVLARAAMDRGSKDNITVVVVDLKNLDNIPEQPDKSCAEEFKGSMSAPAGTLPPLQNAAATPMDA